MARTFLLGAVVILLGAIGPLAAPDPQPEIAGVYRCPIVEDHRAKLVEDRCRLAGITLKTSDVRHRVVVKIEAAGLDHVAERLELGHWGGRDPPRSALAQCPLLRFEASLPWGIEGAAGKGGRDSARA